MEYGFIGESFSHNFSKTIQDIHKLTGRYTYELHEMTPCQADSLIRERNFKGINVTDSCRKTVIPLLDEISKEAERIGAVDTIVNRNGRLRGFNTDYPGLKSLILKTGLDLTGKKVLILGTGVTAGTANAVVTDLGCGPVRMVSRTGKDGALSYEEIYEKYADAEILMNTTPCGMYPDLDACPVDLDRLPCILGVIDVICDPLRTVLVLKAEKRGIPAAGGLFMMVAGAIRAAELGDGSYECATQREVNAMLSLMQRNGDVIEKMCVAIRHCHAQGIYNGAYRTIRLAVKGWGK